MDLVGRDCRDGRSGRVCKVCRGSDDRSNRSDGRGPGCQVGWQSLQALCDRRDVRALSLSRSDGLSDLCCVKTSRAGHVLLSDGLLDALDLFLVSLSVLHGGLLRFAQRPFERVHAVRGGAQTLLQLGDCSHSQNE